MKKTFITLILLTIAIIGRAATTQKVVVVDGVYYELNDENNTAKVIKPLPEVGDNADYTYSGDIVIPSSVANDGTDYKVTAIADEAFKNSKITSVTLPKGLQDIGKYVFMNCKKLTSARLPSDLTFIPEGMFYFCEKLPSITLPDSVKRIGTFAFTYTALTRLDLPCNIIRLDDGALAGLTCVEELKIPWTVEEMGSRLFEACSRLKKVVFEGGEAPIGAECFAWCDSIETVVCKSTVPPVATADSTFAENITSRATLLVPHTALEAYKAADGWSAFSEVSEIKKIEDYLTTLHYEFNTLYRVDSDWNDLEVTDGELWAGYINNKISIGAKGYDPKTVELPKTAEAFLALYDKNGNNVLHQNYDLTSFYYMATKIPKIITLWKTKITYFRGGVYDYLLKLGDSDLTIKKEIVLKDEPTIRLEGTTIPKLGEPIDFNICFNTGFPYDASKLTGDEKVEYTLWSVKGKDDKEELQEIGHQSRKLTLKDNDAAILAAVDTFNIHHEDMELGYYRLQVKSDWLDYNKVFSFIVQDTLSVNVKFDKETYTASDEKAHFALSLRYGFPYIHQTDSGSLPKVKICGKIDYSAIADVTAGETTYEFEKELADEKYATQGIDETNEFDIPLKEILDNCYFEGDTITLKMKLDIEFNEAIQFTDNFKIHILNKATSVESVNGNRDTDATGGKTARIYDLRGIEQKNEKGIYIKGGKVRIKN